MFQNHTRGVENCDTFARATLTKSLKSHAACDFNLMVFQNHTRRVIRQLGSSKIARGVLRATKAAFGQRVVGRGRRERDLLKGDHVGRAGAIPVEADGAVEESGDGNGQMVSG